MQNSVWANKFRRNGNNLKPLTMIAKWNLSYVAVAKERVMAPRRRFSGQVGAAG